jgi:hypothetical protein
LVCVGLAARPRAPGCRPRRGSTFSRGSKTYAQGVCFWVYMEVLEGISSFKRPTTACLRGCSGPGLRQRTAAPPRPGHILWGYMQPALASTSVEVAQTPGGCGSWRRARQEKAEPPARSRQPAATLGAGTTALWCRGASFAPLRELGGEPARGDCKGKAPSQQDCGQRVTPLPYLQTAAYRAPMMATCEVRTTALGPFNLKAFFHIYRLRTHS